jgi:class 3 adenylate cyclase
LNESGSDFDQARTVSDDAVREIHMLAARLRSQFGELDDMAIQAVSETTGMPEDYVRLAVRSVPHEDKSSLVDKIKGAFRAFDPDLRRYTMAAVLAGGCGLAVALSAAIRDTSGFVGTLALLAIVGSIWNSAVSKNLKVALLSGVLFGAVSFLSMTLFTFLVSLIPLVHVIGPPPIALILWIVGGAFFGTLGHSLFAANRQKLGFRDPAKERHELLKQLQDIQDRLRSDEKFVTFLSVDIVESTKIKNENDPLMVEFTFNEYHRYVQSIVERYGGNIHSTAGDGATCVFENPQMAFAAGRALLAGLFEFNSYRNKLNRHVEVRAGVHTGNAHVAGAIINVNFAHVIDVAAHMQKAAAPGGLVVSETTAKYVPGGIDAIAGERIIVHDFSAVLWRPKVKIEAKLVEAPGL